MKRFHRPLFVLLFSLLLIGSQQAALAHMIGHLGGSVETAVSQEEGGHGAALSLSHTCTTCIAFASLDGPPTVPQSLLPDSTLSQDFFVASAAGSAAPALPARRARGPPALL
jgi:hypothetical protein